MPLSLWFKYPNDVPRRYVLNIMYASMKLNTPYSWLYLLFNLSMFRNMTVLNDELGRRRFHNNVFRNNIKSIDFLLTIMLVLSFRNITC